MLLFIDFCELWWLAWLLSFLLGLGLGWLLWYRFKRLLADLETRYALLGKANSKLEADLTANKNIKADLKGDIALMKGRVREMEEEVSGYKSQLSLDGGNASAAASLGASFDAGSSGGTDVSSDLADLRLQLSATTSRADKAEADFKSNIELASSDNASLKGEISDLKGKLSDCESNFQSLQASLSKSLADLSAAKLSGGSNLSSALSAAGAASLVGSDGDGGSNVVSGVNALDDSMDGGLSSKASGSDSSGDVSDLGSAGSSSLGSGTSVSKGAASDPYAKLKPDNLQIVEGIGPKMESVLHENGVKTWSDLAGKSEDELSGILNKYGDRYRIIDPKSWSTQASKASAGEWQGLITLQKSLDGGHGNTGNNDTDSKLEKLMVKMGLLNRCKQDDLKAVEGIGPKIEGLLHNDGINTWRELANTQVSKIQGILDASGSRYKLADPGTWPKQAELAADGKWDELREYQDFFQGGK